MQKLANHTALTFKKLGMRYVRYLSLLVIVFLAACATPPAETTQKVSEDLVGSCRDRFYRGVLGDGSNANTGYQYNSHMRRSFAIGYQGGNQYCSHAWGGWAVTTQEQTDQLALANCNKAIPRGYGCVVYANGNNIIYDKLSHQRQIANQEVMDGAIARRKAEDVERQRRVEAEKLANMRRNEEENAARNLQRLASEKESANLAQSNALEQVKKMCVELGFKTSTETYGKCVLQLLDREQQKNSKEVSAEKLNRFDGAPTRSDGSPDDTKCREFGYLLGTQPYADCRLKMNSMRLQAEERQRDFEQRQREYDANMAEYERQRKIASSLALMQCGLNMAAGNNCSGGRVGPAPVPPSPISPVIQNLILPGGGTVSCTTIGMNTSCR